MKLKSVHIKNFRSIEDSDKSNIGDITCLVGKNESGKTAVLQAIEGINSYRGYKYDRNRDYPRRHLNNYDDRHPDDAAEVCISEWELEEGDIATLEDEFGPGCIKDTSVTITSNYTGIKLGNVKLLTSVVVQNICGNLNAAEKNTIKNCSTTEKVYEKIGEDNPSTKLQDIRQKIEGFKDRSAVLTAILLLTPRIPKFLYFSHYSRMSGEFSIDEYNRCKEQGHEMSESDDVFLEFLRYAKTSIEEIESASEHEEFKSKLEGASNTITDQIFKYWTQNKNLEIEFDVSQGRPKDPAPYNAGLVMRVRVKNRLHRVTVPFSERSAGFIWFFSFLVYFSQVKKNHSGDLIILLDEPGLTLHAKAQNDLLSYIQEELLDKHQIIYTTHSPFMVIADKFDSIRTVEDVTPSSPGRRDVVSGTKISDDFLRVSGDTVFPLQSALGYEISQTLFVGKNLLLVEGPSDILYLKILSQALIGSGRTGLDEKWVICPAGGIDKIAPFIRLYSLRGEERNIVALTDYSSRDSQKIQRLTSDDLADAVLRVSDFCDKKEADIEDLFHKDIYCSLIRQCGIVVPENVSTDDEKRIVPQLNRLLDKFSHYKPASWLLENPNFIEADDENMKETFDRFEKLFSSINKKLKNV